MILNDESTLREKAREVIQAGKLPDRRPDRTRGGLGAGSDCIICNATLKPHEIEFEIEFVGNGNKAGLDKYHVHLRCFAAWELERDNLDLARGGGFLHRSEVIRAPASWLAAWTVAVTNP